MERRERRRDIRDQGSFYLRWDVLPLAAGSGSFQVRGGTQHAFSVGVGTGSVPALITTGAAGLTVAIILALIVGEFD